MARCGKVDTSSIQVIGSIHVVKTDSMGLLFCLIVYSYYSDESSHSRGFNGASQA